MKLEDLNLKEDTIKFSDTLNTDIWEKDELKPQVYNKLMQIADAFIQYLDLSLDIADIQFTGSMANFNFNKDSDIDLHIIVKFSDYDINIELLQDYFNAKKTIFNANHDITIYGHPVELYVEDASKPAESGGKYSLKFDKWIKKPEQITKEVEDVKDSPKYKDLVLQFDNILSSEYNTEEANDLLDNLYSMRKEGLTTSGELSEENLIFKKLRSNGFIQKLRDYITKNYDKNLSLEESVLNEDIQQDSQYRILANKLAKLCIKAIKNDEMLFNTDSAFINMTSAFKKTSLIIKNSPYEYLLRFCDMNVEPNPSFGKSIDGKFKVITFPALTMSINDLFSKIMKKHLNEYIKLKDTTNDTTELAKNIFTKYMRKEILKYIQNSKETVIPSLIHECIHLIDSLRRTQTYKSTEQKFDSDEAATNYWNDPVEQNAYYQETAFLFDEWIKKEFFNLSDWKSFTDFYEDFIRQYRGNYDKLTKPNKEKLIKRAYQYYMNLKL